MAQLPEKERRQPLNGVYEVINPSCTYTAGPMGSKKTAISLGLMSVWAKDVSPKENQQGKILAIVKHPGQNPHEFVAAFQYADSTSVIFIDKNALGLIGGLRGLTYSRASLVAPLQELQNIIEIDVSASCVSFTRHVLAGQSCATLHALCALLALRLRIPPRVETSASNDLFS